MNPTDPIDKLDTPTRYLKGVGAARAAQLEKMGVHTLGDLLATLPNRYENRKQFMLMSDLRPGEQVTVAGRVLSCGWVRPKYGKGFFEAILEDESGTVLCRWFNARYLKDQMKVGDRLVAFGKVRLQNRTPSLQHPEFERIDDETTESIHTQRIVPIYPLTEELGQRTMRRIMYEAVKGYVDAVPEILPVGLRKRRGLVDAVTAMRSVHFPEHMEEASRARFRLVFEEFLAMQVVLAARKLHAERTLQGLSHQPKGEWAGRFVASLSFSLTAAQIRVMDEIAADMAKPHPMHRLLQGDVGSGKTVVAAHAIINAAECGSQAAMMAPTEVLAEQHAMTLKSLLDPLGLRLGLLTGDIKGAEREHLMAQAAAGELDLLVGTHALIQGQVKFNKLGLVVIDEQHKFGVEQRALLYRKGLHPDVLVMTATPIPRTLAMTVYGDLDVSILDELPKGRTPIVTRVINEKQLVEAYQFIQKQVLKGRQAYMVYPLVKDAGKRELRATEQMFEKLNSGIFHELSVGMVHGKMKSEDKHAVMDRFRSGDVQILVSTTVVEVGIDVPNATVMLIEHAERFGLAQLHQLRGRVGRGALKSFCILQGDPETLDSWKRLKIMEETSDGFLIAEEDLKIRGMGNLLGREQSGLPGLRWGHPIHDQDVLKAAREEAFNLVEADPKLNAPEHQGLKDRAKKMHHVAGSMASVG